MENAQAEVLRDFLMVFLRGILSEGLTQPLARWTEGREDPLAQAARDWHDKLAAGHTPEDSLRATTPPFPAPVTDLLLEGLSSGELDYVVEDMLLALAQDRPQAALEGLLAVYQQRRPGTGVCTGCIEREVERIMRRAAAEDATEAHIGWDPAGFMEQRYTGAYVVTVRQPSRETVVAGIGSHVKRRDEPAPGVLRQLQNGAIVLRQGGCTLKIHLEG